MMRWLKRCLLPLPLLFAAALNCLMWYSDHHRWRVREVAHYAFLFGTPWARFLGELPLPNPRSHVLQLLLGYALVLYIPAALYCGCLWILLRIIQGWVDLFALSGKGSPADRDHP